MSLVTAGELRAGALLRLLALTLSPPTVEGRETAADLALALADDESDVDAGRLAEAIGQTSLEVHAATHHHLFGGGVAVAPYESSYELDPFRQARVISDVAGFYRAFGAEARGPAAERPDHAGTELEFLGLLASLRVSALDDGDTDRAERIREIEDAFFDEHAGRWLPGFFRQLARADPDGIFGALGLVGEQTIAAELVARGLEPSPSPSTRAPRTAVEGDELECAAGDDAVGVLGI